MHKILRFPVLLSALLLAGFTATAQQANNTVKIVGTMKNVMMDGKLNGRVDLDTIKNKEHLFGLGPMEYLSGELLIIDGKSYMSYVQPDSTQKVIETYYAKAPFFVYANVATWKEQKLPGKIKTIPQLEEYLNSITQTAQRPFAFKLTGLIESANIHIVNLPKGSKVSSPEEAHKGQKTYPLKNETVEIVGFFSTEHKTVFTHHDSFVHMHLITADKSKMGHLDEALFKKGKMKLFLPVE